MKWGITGGSGQLAQSLTRFLNESNQPFRTWSHQELDVSEISAIEQVAESKVDVLVNCAAWTNVDKAEDEESSVNRVNRDGAMNMALAAKKLGIPLVHISTDYVFSGSHNTPWKITDDTNPTSVYGLSKLLGEKCVIENVEEHFIVRTAWLYGPYGKNFAKTIIKKALTSKDEIKVVHDQKGQPTSTLDLAKQIIKIVQIDAPYGIYHSTNSGSATWWDFAKELVELSGENPNRVIPVSSSDFPSKVKRPSYSVLDNSQWDTVGLAAMPDWKQSLHDCFAEIRSVVERELSVG